MQFETYFLPMRRLSALGSKTIISRMTDMTGGIYLKLLPIDVSRFEWLDQKANSRRSKEERGGDSIGRSK